MDVDHLVFPTFIAESRDVECCHPVLLRTLAPLHASGLVSSRVSSEQLSRPLERTSARFNTKEVVSVG